MEIGSTQSQATREWKTTAVFKTGEGYSGGQIVERTLDDSITVFITRDPQGNSVQRLCLLPKESEVSLERRSADEVHIWTSPDSRTNHLRGSNCVRAQHWDDVSTLSGSGIFGSHQESVENSVEYPIYNPLRLHNREQREIFECSMELLKRIVEIYLETESIPNDLLRRYCWLINTTVQIDNHSKKNVHTIVETISHFCHDYKKFPKGTRIKQPIDCVLMAFSIDGVWTQHGDCWSTIPSDSEGVDFSS